MKGKHLENYQTSDGAEAARDFMASHGMPDDAIRRVWSSIALHTTHSVPEFMESEIALVAAGVETDVDGVGLTYSIPQPSKRSSQRTRDTTVGVDATRIAH
jgi:hypothetical protein